MFTPVAAGKKRAAASSARTPSAPSTPLRASAFNAAAAAAASVAASPLPAMDADVFPSLVLATPRAEATAAAAAMGAQVLEKSERHVISVAGAWPDKLRQEIRPSALAQTSCVVHAISGMVLLVHGPVCYQWMLRKPNETLRRFPLPHTERRVSSDAPSHFVCLTRAEDGVSGMGLLACSVDGNFRYWERVTLTGADEYQEMSSRLDLRADNAGVALVSCEPAGYVFVTRDLSLYRISLRNAMGQTALSYAPLSRPVSVLSRFGTLLGFVGGSAPPAFAPFVTAVAGTKRSDVEEVRDLYLLTQHALQRWDVSNTATEKLIFDENVLAPIQAELENDFRLLPVALARETGDYEPLPSADAAVQLLDMTPLLPSNGRAMVAILVAFSLAVASDETGPEQRCLRYAIVRLATSSLPPQVASIRHLEHRVIYQPYTPGSVRLLHIKLHTFNGGVGALLAAPTFYCLASTVPVKQYDVTVALPESTDRVLGATTDISQLSLPNAIADRDGSSSFYVATLANGILKLDQRLKPVADRAATSSTASSVTDWSATRDRIRSKLQMFVYSTIAGREESPLTGLSQEELLGCLDDAVIEVTKELVRSDSSALPSLLDMRLQLRSKLDRLMRLLRTIHANGGVRSQLRASTQQFVYEAAEKLAAAAALWEYQNATFKGADWSSGAAARNNPTHMLMRSLLQASGAGGDDDRLRAFFQTRVLDLDLSAVASMQKAAEERRATQPIGTQLDVIREMNTIVLILLSAALKCRDELGRHFGALPVDQLESEIWTATRVSVDTLQRQFQFTDDVLRAVRGTANDAFGDVSGADNASERRVILVDQLVELADKLLAVFEDRIRFLKSAPPNAAWGDADDFLDRYREYRRLLLPKLSVAGRRSDALRLGEKHTMPLMRLFPEDAKSSDLALDRVNPVQDLSALVTLCSSDSDEDVRAREKYVGTFGLHFIFPLFSSYVAEGQNHRLLTDPARLAQFTMPTQDGGSRVMDALSLFLHYGSAQQFKRQRPDESIDLQLQWIHALDPDRGNAWDGGETAAAYQALLLASERSTRLAPRKTMTSIAKLLAVSDPDYSSESPAYRRIQAWREELAAQQRLSEILVSFGTPQPAMAAQALGKFADVIVANALSNMQDGTALPMWQLVDALTILPFAYANDGQSNVNVDLATELIPHAIETVSAAAELGLSQLYDAHIIDLLWGTIWRRMLLIDDWQSIDRVENDDDRHDFLMRTATGQILPTAAASVDVAVVVDDLNLAVSKATAEDLRLLAPAYTPIQHQQWLELIEVENDRLTKLAANGRLRQYLHSIMAQ